MIFYYTILILTIINLHIFGTKTMTKTKKTIKFEKLKPEVRKMQEQMYELANYFVPKGYKLDNIELSFTKCEPSQKNNKMCDKNE